MKHKVSQREIGRRIRELRQEKEISASDMAKKIGVARQHIYLIESGKRSLTLHRLQQFSEVLKVDAASLLTVNRKKTA